MFYKFNSFKHGIKNLIKWLKIIWNDRDFDYGYLYEIMYLKLENMQKFFESDNTCSMGAEVYAKQIRECKELLKRIMNEEVFEEYRENDYYTIPLIEIEKKSEEEKNLFWNSMRRNVEKWWD